MNETTGTCEAKKAGAGEAANGSSAVYNNDGSVSFTSLVDYNSAVSFYVDPVTSEDQLKAAEGNEEIKVYDKTKDMSEYDYVRIKVTSANEINARFFDDTTQFASAGWPGNQTDVYEGGWIPSLAEGDEEVWAAEKQFDQGKTVAEKYVTRTTFIPISSLMTKAEKMNALAIGVQSAGVEVTIHSVDFVKVKYDKKVTGINVTAAKPEIVPGKTTTVTAAITPADATRQIVKWTSSDETIATVTYNGTVVAKKGAEGKVTITATSTDGSNVTGSTEITVKEPSDVPDVTESHNVDLTKVVAKTNPGEGDSVAAKQTEASIDFMVGGSMLFVDMSEYLAANNLDLSDYAGIQVTYQLKNQDGSDASEYASAPSWGNFALVTKDDLNGWANPGVLAGNIGNKVADTAVFDFSKADAAGLGTAAGFNFQLPAMDADKYMSFTKIVLVSK